MENVQLFNKLSGDVMKEDLCKETKVESTQDSHKGSNFEQCLANKQAVNQEPGRTLDNSAAEKNQNMPKFKPDDLVQSEGDKILDLEETMKTSTVNIDRKVFDNSKRISMPDKLIDVDRETRPEILKQNLDIDSCRDLSITEESVTGKPELKRKMDDRLTETKLGNEKKKIKLPSEFIATVKNSIAINNKKDKQFFNADKANGKKDDIYSFEDEVLSNENAEFSYHSFDKNVLHKRQSSAKFPSAKRSKLDLSDHHFHSIFTDFYKTSPTEMKHQDEEFEGHDKEINHHGDIEKAFHIELSDAKEVPLTNFGADFTNMVKAAEHNDLQGSFIKDLHPPKYEHLNLPSNLSLRVKHDSISTGRQKGLPSNDRHVTVKMSGKLFDPLSNTDDDKDKCINGNPESADINVVPNGNFLLLKSFPESSHSLIQTSEKSSRESHANDKEQEKCLEKNSKEKVISMITRKESGAAMEKYSEDKTNFSESWYKNGLLKSPYETLLEQSKAHSVNNYENGANAKHNYLGYKLNTDLGMKFVRPPLNGNSVIDKRLEAIRKVSLWIGDCLESTARYLDSPEDLSVNKTVPKAQRQTNGKCASLSETLSTTSSVNNKCASFNVKCAKSKALVKSLCTENMKPACNTNKSKGLHSTVWKCDNRSIKQNLIEIVKCQQNVKENVKCQQEIKEIVKCQQNVKEIVKCQQNVKETGKINGYNAKINSCMDIVQNKTVKVEDRIVKGENIRDEIKKKIQMEYQHDLKTQNHRIDENGRKIITFGKDLRNRKPGNDIEQNQGYKSACNDLLVKNIAEQSSFKSSDNKIVAKNAVENFYGAEVWGFGNDVYSSNNDVVDVNDVKTIINNVANVDESTSKLNLFMNVEDVANNIKCKPDSNVDHVTKDNSHVTKENSLGNVNRNSVDNVSETSEHLETQVSYLECDNRLKGGKITKSNKVCVESGVNRMNRGNNEVIDLTVKSEGISDNDSSFDFTPEHFNLTYPSVVVDMKVNTLNEAPGLPLEFERKENLKDFSMPSAMSYVKCEPNQKNALFIKNVTVSLPELDNVSSQHVYTKFNKGMPKVGESQNINGYANIKSTPQTLVSLEASPHSTVVKPELITEFSGHDWSADDLKNLGLDNSEEDHCLENINPVSLIDCQVSIATGLISVNNCQVSGTSNLVSSSASLSACNDLFSRNTVSIKGNLVPSVGSNPVSSICDSENQLAEYIGCKSHNFEVSNRNQFPSSIVNAINGNHNVEDAGNQFVENTGTRFSNSVNNAENGNQSMSIAEHNGNQFPLDDLPQLIGESEDYQWNETLKSFIMQNLDDELKEENGTKEPAADVELLLEQKLAEQYLNRNIESLKLKNSIDL